MANSNFKMVGFKHVTEEGVAAYWTMMDSWGTIGLIWDISNQMRVDTLMCEKDYDISLFIEQKFNLKHDEGFDELMVEIHEEMCDARFALEYAFVMGHTDIACHKDDGRRFYNLDKLPEATELVQETVYPTELMYFDSWNELGEYCCNTLTAEGPDHINVTVRATGDGYPDQELVYKVSGAEVHNAIGEAVNGLLEAGYSEFKYIVR